jgi:hypothetical protein
VRNDLLVSVVDIQTWAARIAGVLDLQARPATGNP